MEPELPTPVGTVPSGARWIHETKFDGYGGFRIIKKLLFERWVSRRALPVVVRMKTETGGPEPSLIPFTLVADGAEVLVDTKNNQDEFRGNARKNDSDQHAGDR